ncbi:hypothetical protein Pcinc_004587 [Petrolisthes cinctipes]|uniref:Uncharacterized protein n=1 Tax=Petrolisthes cinctipes TaxID=88211 RepID=A0AAE1GGR2_PETCI|nr:hypothetical protein Pcinc_004587 [Petrolisthes cinctipes]
MGARGDQCRNLSNISKFNCTFKYLPGKKNTVADAHSIIELDAVQLGLDYSHLANEQQRDTETPAVRTSFTALQRKDVSLDNTDTTIICNVSTGRPHPWIPAPLHRHVFNLVFRDVQQLDY